MQTRTFLISVILGWIGAGHLPAMAEQQPVYRLAQTWPQLPQPWYFGQLNHIALTPEGDLWVQDASNYRMQKLQAKDGKILKQLSLGARFSLGPFDMRGVNVAADGSLWMISTIGQLLHMNADGSLIAEVLPEWSVKNGVDWDVAKDGSFWFIDTKSSIYHFDPRLQQLSQFKNDCADLAKMTPETGARANDGSYWVVENIPTKLKHFSADGIEILTINAEETLPGRSPYFSEPMIALDGSIWVIDISNKSLLHYKVDGGLIAEIGVHKNEPDQLISPNLLSLAKDGSFWLIDTTNSRLQHLNAEGGLIKQIDGRGITTEPFNNIFTMAIAGDGSLWINDFPTIKHYTAQGEFIAKLSNAQQLTSPTKVIVAPDDSLWVINENIMTVNGFTSFSQIYHFGSDGRFLGQLGAEIIFSATDIAFADDGSIWVRSGINLHHFAADKHYIDTLSGDKTDCRSNRAGQFNNPQSLAVAADGSLWVADTDNNRIQHLTPQGVVISITGRKGTAAGLFNQPVAIAVAKDNSVWVVDKENDRLQQFSAAGKFIKQIGGGGTKAGQMLKPSDVAISIDGTLWVADTVNRRIQHFKADGSFIKQFGRSNNDATQEKIFDEPKGLAFDVDGSLWLGNVSDTALLHLDIAGNVIGQLGMTVYSPPDGSFGKFPVPYGKIPAADGSLWRLEPNNTLTMQRMSGNGQVLATIQNSKDSEYDTHTIKRLETLKDGSVWSFHGRWVYTGRITFESFWLEHHTAAGVFVSKFTSPFLRGEFDFAVDNDGSLWTTSAGERKVLHLDETGKEIGHFDVPSPSGTDASSLGGITINAAGVLWVADPSNHRIVKFVPNTRPTLAAEYDGQQQILYLDDVVVDGNHYQATLQHQTGLFNLSSFSSTKNLYTLPAQFDRATDFLTIPLARAMGQDYQAGFKHIGNQVFELQSLRLQ